MVRDGTDGLPFELLVEGVKVTSNRRSTAAQYRDSDLYGLFEAARLERHCCLCTAFRGW